MASSFLLLELAQVGLNLTISKLIDVKELLLRFNMSEPIEKALLTVTELLMVVL